MRVSDSPRNDPDSLGLGHMNSERTTASLGLNALNARWLSSGCMSTGREVKLSPPKLTEPEGRKEMTPLKKVIQSR